MSATMPLDEKSRKKRAIKAGKASGKARHPREMTERDKNIVLAYLFLTNSYQPNQDRQKAFKFLSDNGTNPNLQPGETPYRKLADMTGLTRSRIQQIIKKASG